MKWIGLLIVSPLWGMISAQLFLQAWLALSQLIIAAAGFVRGRVPRSETAMGMGVYLLQTFLWSLLLSGGYWLLANVLGFGWTNAENVVYWIFVALSAVYMLPQIPSRLRRAWHFSMTPGTLEGCARARRS